jgi:hypothetical protein
MQESYSRIRLAVNVNAPGSVLTPTTINNVLTAASPAAFVATDIRFEIGLFSDNATTPLDVSNLSSIQLDLKNPNALFTAPSLWTKIASGGGITAMTLGAWQAGTGQNCLLPMTSQESNLSIPDNENYVLVLSGITNDNPGRLLVFGATPIEFWPSGLGVSGSAPINPATYYSGAQSDTRYLPKVISPGTGTVAFPATCPAANQQPTWMQILGADGNLYDVPAFKHTP